ncbi:MAG: hypothetical protein H7840_02650 [Alphaproteobacteria bacterium]
MSVLIRHPDGRTEGPYGYGPKDSDAKNGVYGPGVLKDESKDKEIYTEISKNGPITPESIGKLDGVSVSNPVSMTPEEFGKFRDVYTNLENNPGHYSAPFGGADDPRNCASTIWGAMKEAGKDDKDLSTIFDGEDLKGSAAGREFERLTKPNPEGYQPPRTPDDDGNANGKPGSDTPAGTQQPSSPEPEQPPQPQSSPEPTPQPAPQENAPAPTEQQPEQKPEQSATLRPEVQSLVESIRQPPDDPARTVLLKKPQTWTEKERDLAINTVFDLPDSDPRRQETQEGVSAWYKHYYPGKVQWDATGKMIDPGPAFPFPQEPTPVVTHDGKPFEDVLDRFGRHVADTSGDAPVPEVVKSLQSGLNMLTMEKKEKAPAKKWTPPLEEDGDFGPMTRDILHKILVRHGPGRAEEALALGRFNGFARQASETLDPIDLKSTTETAFGPLFPRGNSGDAHAMVARTLQDTVNDVAADQDDDRHPSIAVDGDIGPETARGFGRSVGAVGAEDFTRRFARNLGFFRSL